MHTGSCKATYHDTVFENVTSVYKKVPRTARARVSSAGQPRNFHGYGGVRYNCLQVTNPARACKHKNSVVNNSVSLRVTTVDVTHFTTVCVLCVIA